eukprot:gene4345-8650_t
MGSGTSSTQSKNLPLKVSLVEARRLCGARFDEKLYNSSKDIDGNLDRTHFIRIVKSQSEQELSTLFFKHCPDGQMDNRAFHKFLKECKVFSKKFTSADADIIFQRAKSKGTGKIQYNVFRGTLLPEVAAKLSIDVHELIKSLYTTKPDDSSVSVNSNSPLPSTTASLKLNQSLSSLPSQNEKENIPVTDRL